MLANSWELKVWRMGMAADATASNRMGWVCRRLAKALTVLASPWELNVWISSIDRLAHKSNSSSS